MTPRQSETPSTSLSPIDRSHSAYKRFQSEHRQKNFWMAVAFGTLFFCVLAMMAIVAQMRQPVYSFSTDGAGAIYFAPMGVTDARSPVVSQVALQACLAILSRSPAGLDYKDFAEKLFTRPAYDKLVRDYDSEKQRLETMSMHTKPEVSDISPLGDAKDGRRVMLVKGQLIMTGIMQGYPITEVDMFELRLAIVPNKNMLERGQTPFTVTGFKVERSRVQNPDNVKGEIR